MLNRSCARKNRWLTGLCLGALGWLSAAGAETPGSTAVDRNQAQAAFEVGKRYLEQGQLDYAGRLFRQAIGMFPEAPGPYRVLAFTVYRQGDCEEALGLLASYRTRLEQVDAAAALHPMASEIQRTCEARRRSLFSAKGGTLVLAVSPAGAQVRLDGRIAGTAPLTLLDLAPGQHRMELTLAGYSAVEQEFRITPGQTTSLQVQLLRTAELSVFSQPDGAVLALDQRPLGPTPFHGTALTAGPHRFTLSHPTRPSPWSATIELPPGGALTLSVVLAAEGGHLTVQSQPAGALVTLDDQPVGCTPLGPNLVAAGDHRLGLVLPGHALVEQAIRVEADRTLELDLRLRPILLDVRVRGGRDDLFLFVNGERRPLDQGWLRALPPGEHDITAYSQGYPIWSRRLHLEPGQEAELELPAITPASRHRALWLVTGTTVAVAALFGGGWLGYQAIREESSLKYLGAAGLGSLGVAASLLTFQLWLSAAPAELGPPPDPAQPESWTWLPAPHRTRRATGWGLSMQGTF